MANDGPSNGICWAKQPGFKRLFKSNLKGLELDDGHYLLRLPLANKSSTAPCRLPPSSSWTVSHERVYVASQEYADLNGQSINS